MKMSKMWHKFIARKGKILPTWQLEVMAQKEKKENLIFLIENYQAPYLPNMVVK